jgi:NTE family protein
MTARKYKLGAAFSGGGAKAAAHCGALQAMHEFGLKPDIVSGTSAGSLVAIYYSCGFKPQEIVEQFLGMNFFKDIVAPTLPKGGMFDSKPLIEHLRKHLPYTRLEDLPIPTYVVASDMEHGTVKVFSRGEIAPRAVASCSIPVIFNPIVIGGVHYVDGGAFQNLPVPAIRQKCEKVIAFNLNHLYDEPYKNNVLAVAYRSFFMMFMSNIVADARHADILVDLDTEGCSAYDMTKLEELFFRGYASTVKVLEQNGYTRIMPPEEITFTKKKGSKIKKQYFL